VRIAVPTRFMRDWVVGHYAERIRGLWLEEDAAITDVDIFVQSQPAPRVAEVPAAPAPVENLAARRAPEPRAPVSFDLVDGDFGAPLDPRFTFENFVVGKPNELAYAAARRVADSTTATYNPLFLYGG